VAELVFSLLKSLPYMLRDSSPADKLFKDGAQNTCSGLFLLGKEVAVESYKSNVLPCSLITQAINYEGAIICKSSVTFASPFSRQEAFLPDIGFPHPRIPITEQHRLNTTIFHITPFSELVGF